MNKANFWKQLIQVIITVLTAIATTLGTASCMGL
ncbi:MAG: smalltalk protein [Prevotella sp.]|nr:smalltalk protein [Prevotella sp.]